VAALAKFLEAGDLGVARVVHSGKRRAEETAAMSSTAASDAPKRPQRSWRPPWRRRPPSKARRVSRPMIR
jgi:phosphohistidine phosphatase SixA